MESLGDTRWVKCKAQVLVSIYTLKNVAGRRGSYIPFQLLSDTA